MFDIQLFKKSAAPASGLMEATPATKPVALNPPRMGRPGQGGVGCFLLIRSADVNQRSCMFGARVLVLLDSSNWTPDNTPLPPALGPHPKPGEFCFPWLSLSGLTFPGPLGHQRDFVLEDLEP